MRALPRLSKCDAPERWCQAEGCGVCNGTLAVAQTSTSVMNRTVDWLHCRLARGAGVAAMFTGAALFAADLPVRQVVLYKHGVGYFERAGQLGPGETARLDFKASEMNDVLKSLTLE